MSFQVILTNQAKTDLINIYNYIAYDLQSLQSAEDLLSRLEKAIFSLDQMPGRYRVYVPEKHESKKWKERNLRIMPVGNYLVFFIPSQAEKVGTVLRILYGGRDIGRQFDDMQ